MSLFHLPPEILARIFDFVGSEYFRQGGGRLTICKAWLEFARIAFFQDLELPQEKVRSLIDSRYMDQSLTSIKDNTATLELRLRGFTGWEEVSFENERVLMSGEGDAWGREMQRILTSWTAQLNTGLFKLADALRESRKLRILCIVAELEDHPGLTVLPQRDYLFLPTIMELLSMRTLRVLELDLVGTSLLSVHSDSNDNHICPSIAALLSTLQYIRLRLRQICPSALLLPHKGTEIPLRKALVNLSLRQFSSISVPQRCSTKVQHYPQLKSDIEDAARTLASRMRSPTTVRVLFPRFPRGNTQLLDVLTGKSILLDEGADLEEDWEGGGAISSDESTPAAEYDITSVSDIPTPP